MLYMITIIRSFFEIDQNQFSKFPMSLDVSLLAGMDLCLFPKKGDLGLKICRR